MKVNGGKWGDMGENGGKLEIYLGKKVTFLYVENSHFTSPRDSTCYVATSNNTTAAPTGLGLFMGLIFSIENKGFVAHKHLNGTMARPTRPVLATTMIINICPTAPLPQPQRPFPHSARQRAWGVEH